MEVIEDDMGIVAIMDCVEPPRSCFFFLGAGTGPKPAKTGPKLVGGADIDDGREPVDEEDVMEDEDEEKVVGTAGAGFLEEGGV